MPGGTLNAPDSPLQVAVCLQYLQGKYYDKETKSIKADKVLQTIIHRLLIGPNASLEEKSDFTRAAEELYVSARTRAGFGIHSYRPTDRPTRRAMSCLVPQGAKIRYVGSEQDSARSLGDPLTSRQVFNAVDQAIKLLVLNETAELKEDWRRAYLKFAKNLDGLKSMLVETRRPEQQQQQAAQQQDRAALDYSSNPDTPQDSARGLASNGSIGQSSYPISNGLSGQGSMAGLEEEYEALEGRIREHLKRKPGSAVLQNPGVRSALGLSKMLTGGLAVDSQMLERLEQLIEETGKVKMTIDVPEPQPRARDIMLKEFEELKRENEMLRKEGGRVNLTFPPGVRPVGMGMFVPGGAAAGGSNSVSSASLEQESLHFR